MDDTLNNLKNAIRYAPKNPCFVAAGLIGWMVRHDLFVCAQCAGRIFARGCSIPSSSQPVWEGDGKTHPVCSLCSEANK